MSATSSQEFRDRSTSETILIPTRQDPKSRLRIVLWKDIMRCFEHAKYIMCRREMVLFLTNDEFEDLTPLRIPHHPGEVLEVVTTDGHQGDSSSTGLSVARSSSQDTVPVTRNVDSLRTSGAGDNQTLIVRSQGYPPDRGTQMLPILITNHHQPEAEDNMTLQEQLHQLQNQVQQMNQQMEDLGKIQQTSQQGQDTEQLVQQLQNMQQQMRDDIDTTLQQTQHSMQQLEQRVGETQQYEGVLVTSQQQLQQQLEEIQQKMQQSDQETQDNQQQLNEAVEKIRRIDQQALHFQQHYKNWLEKVREVKKISQQQDHLSLKAVDQFIHAQYHVQAVLAKPPSESPIPRLFIILPEPTGVVDAQGRPCSLQFRLYYLCECGTHTMSRNSSKPHEVHLAKHPGYDLNNQSEVINKFGSYLLTMMYTVKYGANAGGLGVPPLLGLNRAIADGAGEWRTLFIRENISRLVDDTITYLQEAIGSSNGDLSTRHSLDVVDLTELKSYLRSKTANASQAV